MEIPESSKHLFWTEFHFENIQYILLYQNSFLIGKYFLNFHSNKEIKSFTKHDN
jgi:hypothetical protein